MQVIIRRNKGKIKPRGDEAMQYRTDLALEEKEQRGSCRGVKSEEKITGDVTVSKITVETEEGSRSLGKPKGCYVTIEFPALTDNSFIPDERYEAVSAQLGGLLPAEGTVLVCGLGNRRITPDALGPKTASQIAATRHIADELRRSAGFDALRSCAVISPGVLGQTGIEVVDLLRSLCRQINPSAVIVIDAMASRRLSRLGCTVQISDAGISPGAGVGNNRPSISFAELGIPVISVGVPTVVEASTLAYDLTDGRVEENIISPRGETMIVTPREVDLLIDRSSRLLALSINHALHPTLDPVELLSIV